MEFGPVWPTPDAMCRAHVTDTHLLARLPSTDNGSCVVCEDLGTEPQRARFNLTHLAEVVEQVAQTQYDHEGFFVDGEQLLHPLSIAEVATSLLEGSVRAEALETVVRVIAPLILEERAWFVPFDEALEASREFEWRDFEETVKHKSRLLTAPAGPSASTPPEMSYEFVKSLMVFAEERSGLVHTLAAGVPLFRARAERDSIALMQKARELPSQHLGPAPAELAAPGRMNAQGVSLFYGALDAETACAEVALHSPYDEAVVGAFVLKHDLRILDLTQVTPPRSVFEPIHRSREDERLASLNFYVDRITQPVIVDGNHPVDYVPSQLLTEAFRWWVQPSLDGIAYPSRVREGGTNVVLFFGDPQWFESLNVPASRFAALQREMERGRPDPIAIIDPASVRRFTVHRDVRIARSNDWAVSHGF